jgi:hypothetical protein
LIWLSLRSIGLSGRWHCGLTCGLTCGLKKMAHTIAVIP